MTHLIPWFQLSLESFKENSDEKLGARIGAEYEGYARTFGALHPWTCCPGPSYRTLDSFQSHFHTGNTPSILSEKRIMFSWVGSPKKTWRISSKNPFNNTSLHL
jgi:hypothetical protein